MNSALGPNSVTYISGEAVSRSPLNCILKMRNLSTIKIQTCLLTVTTVKTEETHWSQICLVAYLEANFSGHLPSSTPLASILHNGTEVQY